MKTQTFAVCVSCTHLSHRLNFSLSSASCCSCELCSRWHNLTDMELSCFMQSKKAEGKKKKRWVQIKDPRRVSSWQSCLRFPPKPSPQQARGGKPYDCCKGLRAKRLVNVKEAAESPRRLKKDEEGEGIRGLCHLCCITGIILHVQMVVSGTNKLYVVIMLWWD